MRPAATLVVFMTGLVLAILATVAAPAAAATEATTALQICGTLREHRPATSSATGSLTIGTRTYVVASGIAAGNGGVTIETGRDLCVTASLGRTSGQLVRYLFFWMLTGDRVCGNNLAAGAETVTLAADFGELTLRRAASIATGQERERRCYAHQVDRASGDLVATAVLPLRDTFGDRERNSHCGTVREYTRATAAGSGSITIGSRSWRIAAGLSYTGDPAGDRTDRTTVGSNMCLTATLGAAGEIVEYLTGTMPTSTGGSAAAYTPPAGDRPGIAVLAYASRHELRIPASVDAAGDIARGSFCYSAGVDAPGDMSAIAMTTCSQGTAAGPTGVPGTAASASPGPSTATASATTGAPSPSATATATPTPVAVTSPTPEGTISTTSVRVGPDPLLVAGLTGIAALGLLALYLARRRAS